MRNINRLFMILSALVLSGVLGAPTAWAVDDKVYPGTMCVRDNNGGGSAYYSGSGRLFNASSTSAMTVTCPIVRDNTTSPWSLLQAVVIDNNTTSNATCRGVTSNRDGTAQVFGPTQSTSGNSSAGKILSFGPLSEVDNGYFFLRCTIPLKQSSTLESALSSYFIREP